MDLPTVAGLAGLIVSVIAILSATGWGLKHGFHFIRLSVRAFDDIVGSPGRAGLMDRIDRVEEKLTAVSHELHPNSGESLRDSVDRIEVASQTAAETAKYASKQVAALAELMRDKRAKDNP